MEASEAAPSEGTEQTTATPEEGGEETQPQSPSLDPEVLDRINQLSESVPQIQEQLESLQQPQEPEPQEPGFLGGEPELYDAYGNPVGPDGQPLPGEGEIDPQALQSFINENISTAVKDAMSPYVEKMEEQRIVQEAAALEQEFPELKDPQVAGATVEKARELAETMGQPELAADPQFVKVVYQAGKAEQLAAQVTPAGESQGADLETGAGTQSGEGEEDDTAMRIVNAGRDSDRKVLPGLF